MTEQAQATEAEVASQSVTPTAEKPVDPLAELNARRQKYGVAYAIFAEGMSGTGMNRSVMVAKIVIGVIAAYALVSAVLTGIGG